MFDISSEREENVRSILDGIMTISEIGSEQFRVTVIGDFIIPLKEAVAMIKERSLSDELMPLFRKRKGGIRIGVHRITYLPSRD